MATSKKKPGRDDIVEATMALAAERPWDDIELGDIAEAAGITLADLRESFPSKGAVLGGFARKIDMAVLAGNSDDLIGEPARERLFDVYMRYLDALAPYKVALRRIAVAVRREPLTLAALNQVALNSHRYMLAAAHIPTEDALGPIKLQGSVLTMARVLETWLEDDAPELAQTMARLDRELGRAERFMERAEDFHRVTAPFRAIGQAIMEGGARMRQRRRDGGYGEDDGADAGPDAGIDRPGEDRDPAAAI
ncbi:TetR/AcrR family transcriptional regulator [Saliniramus sp.]|uniref:TetR/AcrR family transcriptional regulator n=1 Tax=Saliniramus sp. TaxID=2986772 RepID=UPI002BB38C59|nr:TetR/AcrR family transcriptional regulator [Saliniramus sp.]HMB09771.1 TetR/AcrR family transcriptional regulator [Saliniramus sp.]